MDYSIICDCANSAATQAQSLTASEIVTIGISIASLLLNILFYTIIAPQMSFRFQRKSDFLKYASEFVEYLSKINSFEDFDGVPTKVKSYCVSIELLFKSGIAPEPLHSNMELVFQDVKNRKTLSAEKDIQNWEKEFRVHSQTLRKDLAKYTGIFK